MLKIPALVLAVVVTSVPSLDAAQAQGRPDSLRMSCSAARGLVSTRGAIVLGSGRNIYDRYVASQGFCQRDEVTKPAWVPAADTPQCFIGYRCERLNDDDFPF